MLLERGAHVPGADDHGADAVAPQFHAKAFGEGANGEFRGAIERQPGQRNFAGDGTDVDDHASVPGAHLRDHELGYAEQGEEIELEQMTHFVERRAPGGQVQAGSGIVDEDVDGAEAIERAIDHGSADFLAGDVAGRDERVMIGCGGAETGLGTRRKRELGARPREFGGARRADSFRSARDEDHFAVESHARAASLCVFKLVLIRRKRHNVSMSSGLIPLFPLQVVVFPRTALPLHIFEERYKEMVGAAIRDNSEFGIVLAREDGIVNAGCTVVVEKLKQMYPDGRMDVLTRGKRRFEIESLNEEKAYLQAHVTFFDDDDFSPTPNELREQVCTQYQALSQLGTVQVSEEPDLKDPQLSFQLAHAVPDLNFLSVLLRKRSETGRLTDLNEYLSQYIPRQRAIERVKALAPTNGHGGPPTGM